MGSRDWDLSLRDVGHLACQMRGFPGVGLLTRQGKLIAVNVGRNRAFRAMLVTLAPGKSAYFTFEFESAGPCIPRDYSFYGLEIYPPNDRGRLVLHIGQTGVCDVAISGTPSVTPVRASKELG